MQSGIVANNYHIAELSGNGLEDYLDDSESSALGKSQLDRCRRVAQPPRRYPRLPFVQIGKGKASVGTGTEQQATIGCLQNHLSIPQWGAGSVKDDSCDLKTDSLAL